MKLPQTSPNIPIGEAYRVNDAPHQHGHIVYRPVSVTVTASDGETGTVADAQTMRDGLLYQVEEVAATPGFDFYFTFQGVIKQPQWVVLRYRYQGSDTHWVQLRLRNYVTGVDDAVDLLRDTQGYYEVRSAYLGFDLADYMNSSNEMRVQLYHVTAGNASHVFYVDFCGLVSEL